LVYLMKFFKNHHNKAMLLKVNRWAKNRPPVAFSKLRRYVS